MRKMLFDMGSSEDCKGPEEIAEIHVDEHSLGHAANGEVRAFSNTILWWRVSDGFFVCDTMCLAM
jgi:hypothetical protein